MIFGDFGADPWEAMAAALKRTRKAVTAVTQPIITTAAAAPRAVAPMTTEQVIQVMTKKLATPLTVLVAQAAEQAKVLGRLSVDIEGATKQYNVVGDRLKKNSFMIAGDCLVSPDKRFALVFDNDGDLKEIETGSSMIVWGPPLDSMAKRGRTFKFLLNDSGELQSRTFQDEVIWGSGANCVLAPEATSSEPLGRFSAFGEGGEGGAIAPTYAEQVIAADRARAIEAYNACVAAHAGADFQLVLKNDGALILYANGSEYWTNGISRDDAPPQWDAVAWAKLVTDWVTMVGGVENLTDFGKALIPRDQESDASYIERLSGQAYGVGAQVPPLSLQDATGRYFITGCVHQGADNCAESRQGIPITEIPTWVTSLLRRHSAAATDGSIIFAPAPRGVWGISGSVPDPKSQSRTRFLVANVDWVFIRWLWRTYANDPSASLRSFTQQSTGWHDPRSSGGFFDTAFSMQGLKYLVLAAAVIATVVTAGAAAGAIAPAAALAVGAGAAVVGAGYSVASAAGAGRPDTSNNPPAVIVAAPSITTLAEQKKAEEDAMRGQAEVTAMQEAMAQEAVAEAAREDEATAIIEQKRAEEAVAILLEQKAAIEKAQEGAPSIASAWLGPLAFIIGGLLLGGPTGGLMGAGASYLYVKSKKS